MGSFAREKYLQPLCLPGTSVHIKKIFSVKLHYLLDITVTSECDDLQYPYIFQNNINSVILDVHLPQFLEPP